MAAATDLGLRVGLKAACRAFSLNRAFVYRERLRARPTVLQSVVRVRMQPPLAFCAAEQTLLLVLLNSERFAEVAPAAIFAILLDEGRYHGSIRTMYRLLSACHQSGERRCQCVRVPVRRLGRGLRPKASIRVHPRFSYRFHIGGNRASSDRACKPLNWRRERDYSALRASPLRGRPPGVNATESLMRVATARD
jgi:hypothetical protein